VADLLRRDIGDGGARWKLPSEHELIGSFGVSRNTVRVALDLLREEGLLQRITGAGTFTSEMAVRHQLDLTRIPNDDLFGRGDLERQVLLAERRPAPPPLARMLEIAPGDETLLLEKIVRLHGSPLYHATDWFRSSAADGVLASDLTRETSDILVSLGHRLGQVESSLEAVVANEADAAALEVDVGAPLLLLEVRLRLADGSPVECSFIRLRADRLTIGPRLVPLDPPSTPEVA
jgi:GntR family transcriptional regulator